MIHAVAIQMILVVLCSLFLWPELQVVYIFGYPLPTIVSFSLSHTLSYSLSPNFSCGPLSLVILSLCVYLPLGPRRVRLSALKRRPREPFSPSGRFGGRWG
jgi:hypothetical protein